MTYECWRESTGVDKRRDVGVGARLPLASCARRSWMAFSGANGPSVISPDRIAGRWRHAVQLAI